MPVPIPDLSVNMNTASKAGDIDGKKSTAFNFNAPVINQSMNPYLLAGLVIAGALIYKGKK